VPQVPDPGDTQKIEKSSVEMTGKIACSKCGMHVGAGTAICPNDGTILLDASALVPKLAGEYEFICEIGSGGMGVIYKARHLALNQLVAIKMLHANRLNETSLRRFQQEAKAISSLDHPGIVRVRDFGATESGQPHLILDFIQGETLSDYVSRQGALPVSDAIDIFIDVADALEHAHERGILHRDLKPSNIMLVENKGRLIVKIVDFGIAKMLGEEATGGKAGLTQTGEIFGSPAYMSPEQTSGETLDYRSDVYSLGCVLFEALTGAPPFSSKNPIEILFQQVNDAPPSLKQASLGKTYPPELEMLVAKALRKKRTERFTSMRELKEALIDSKLGKRHDSLIFQHVEKKRTDDSKLILICASCVIVAAGLAIWSIFQSTAVKPEPALKTPPPNAFEKLPTSDDAARKKISESITKKKIRLGGWVNDEALSAFDKCTITEDVDLSGTAINGEGLEHLIRLPLRKLNLRASALTDVGLIKVGKMLALEDLNIRQTPIRHDANLEQLANLPHLRKLNVMTCKVGDMGMEAIGKIRSLQSLNIEDNSDITTAGMDSIGKLPALTELEISHGQVESFLMDARLFGALQVLGVNNVDISHLGKNILSGLQIVPLRVLKLHKVKMSNAQFASLGKLRYLKTIQLITCPEISQAMQLDLRTARPDLKIEQGKETDDLARYEGGDF